MYSYTNQKNPRGAGFEPAKHIAEDLQSPPFGHLDTPKQIKKTSSKKKLIFN